MDRKAASEGELVGAGKWGVGKGKVVVVVVVVVFCLQLGCGM